MLPGTVKRSLSCSMASCAVMSAPLFLGASTITTPWDKPLMMRFLAGKFPLEMALPGGYSEATSPPDSTICSIR